MATEVGLCELASMHKRAARARFRLVALELMDFNQAWVQPEVDLYVCTHPDLAAELVAAGATACKIVTSGQPIELAILAERVIPSSLATCDNMETTWSFLCFSCIESSMIKGPLII